MDREVNHVQSAQISRLKAADAKAVDRQPVHDNAVLAEASCSVVSAFHDIAYSYTVLQASACVADATSHCVTQIHSTRSHPVLPNAVQNTKSITLLQVAKVGVHSSHLLDIQCIPSKWVRAECHKSGLDIDRPFRVIRLLMRHLQSLPEGQYMLAHQAGASAVVCFRAAPDGLLDGQVGLLQAL